MYFNLKNKFKKENFSKKGVSPLIAVILLIVVSVAIVTIVLNFGKDFTTDSLDSVTSFNQEYTADTLTILNVKNFVNNKLIIDNLKSNGDVNVVGYKILSQSSHPFLNKVNYLPEPVVFSEGKTSIISIVQPPEKTFDVQLITNENKYLSVKDVQNDSEKSFAKLLTDDASGGYGGQYVIETVTGDYVVFADGESNNSFRLYILNSQGDLKDTVVYTSDNELSLFRLIETNNGGFGVFFRGRDYPDPYTVSFVKFDSSGSEINSYNKDFGFSSYPFDIINTLDGGFLLVGQTSISSTIDLFVIKLNSECEEEGIYVKSLETNNLYFNSVFSTLEGGYGLFFNIYGVSESLFVNLNSDLTENFSSVIDSIVYPIKAINGKDNSFLLLGTKNYDLVFVKLDDSGAELNSYICEDASFSNYDTSIIESEDGGYGFVGVSTDRSLHFIKLGPNLIEENTYEYDAGTYGASYHYLNYIKNIGFNLVFNSNAGSNSDVVFIRFNLSGDEEKTYIYDSGYSEHPDLLISSANGENLIFGRGDAFPEWYNSEVWSNVFLIKLNSEIEEEFVSLLGGGPANAEGSGDYFPVLATSDGGVIFTGWTGGFGSYDWLTQSWVVKTDSKGNCPQVRDLPQNPNPGEV